MPRRPTRDVVAHQLGVIELIEQDSLSISEIIDRLRPKASRRSVLYILAWLRRTYPRNILREQATGYSDASRIVYRWIGVSPTLLRDPLTWLAEDELIALVAARGMLRNPDQALPATSSQPDDRDLLAKAIAAVLGRTGTREAADLLARHSVTVSRFGAAQVDPGNLEACFAATVTGQALEFGYINRKGTTSRRHVAPQRMVLIKSEWYIIAWDGFLRTFRLERMTTVKRRSDMPPGKPVSIPTHRVDALLRDAFYATGSEDTKDRKKVVMAVGPDAWPFITGRRWGDKQRIDDHPPDLPVRWRRLTFVTSGIEECGHWALGMGENIRVEHPRELAEWIIRQAQAILTTHQRTESH